MTSADCTERAYEQVLTAAAAGCGGSAVTFSLLLPETLFLQTVTIVTTTNTTANATFGRRLQSLEDYSALTALVRVALQFALENVPADDILVTAHRASLTVDIVVLEGGLPASSILALTSSNGFLASVSTYLGVNVTFMRQPSVVVDDFSELQRASTPISSSGPEAQNETSAPSGAAAPTVTAIVSLLLIVAALIWLWRRRRSKRELRTSPEMPYKATSQSQITPNENRATGEPPSPTSLQAQFCTPDGQSTRGSARNLLPWWVAHFTEDGSPYYFNERTFESSWTAPLAPRSPAVAEMQPTRWPSMVQEAEAPVLAAGTSVQHPTSGEVLLQQIAPAATAQNVSALPLRPPYRTPPGMSMLPGWTRHTTEDGSAYYFNERTQESSWTAPVAAPSPQRPLLSLPSQTLVPEVAPTAPLSPHTLREQVLWRTLEASGLLPPEGGDTGMASHASSSQSHSSDASWDSRSE